MPLMHTLLAQATGGARPAWELHDRLRKARTFAGLTPTQLGEEIEMSQQSISGAETGRTKPRRHTVVLWALATGVDYEWLAGEDYPDAPRSSSDEHRGRKSPNRLDSRLSRDVRHRDGRHRDGRHRRGNR